MIFIQNKDIHTYLPKFKVGDYVLIKHTQELAQIEFSKREFIAATFQYDLPSEFWHFLDYYEII